ncbi:MAG: L,D-transpeptidase [Gammaproteobacteria bacterium]|jgi:lipoprotein-anchoring transpeptidase ErfK/SrfK|uniref:L,D-transpeptidase n=1 Tax=unclassified Acidiferrobacter TaxID=2640868 RepID=UPI000D73C8BA|nr:MULTISPECIES: L,D-transpeptidase [unclassified Acidiferrobacter]AWP23521.1 L,D-transpeptidase [Acidiferrobacter sp. SPIII_3]MDA8119920.1 L,D-transpeptidase [Gammaproteobacteria bacterium]
MSYIEVDVAAQRLRLCEREGGRVIWETAVATAKNGVGERYGSYQTPRGLHVVRAKIGDGAARGTVFVGRRPTGEIYSPALRRLHPQRDWVLTRILWLSGLTAGENRLGEVDTMRRYIYIHGAPDEDPMGIPSSHGCIKMRNDEVMELFDRVPPGTRVRIIA